MRAVVQRVKNATVRVNNKIVGSIDKGLLLFLGISTEDKDEDFNYIFNKVIKLRVFDDDQGIMNKSLLDYNLELLVVSQFTLYGDGRKGNRPSYVRAAKFDEGKIYYEKFIDKALEMGIKTEKGEYGGDMDIELVNDGPVTILLDSEKKF
ncbi:MAG: D-aminoacyl-tRNA deacylase [Tissierellia bacterium]|nr:D-aminoacyl-tRNA deacylase [Tissierellia bacterium]